MIEKLIFDPTSPADGHSVGSYLLDSAGNQLTSTLVSGKQSLDVNVTQSALPAGAATEATLATRASEATLATRASEATVAAILADTATIDSQTLSIQNTLSDLSKAEDAAHSSGDQGIMSLAVRNDAESSLVSADGDYAPLQVSATGRLKVDAELSSSAEYAEDSAHVSGDIGNFMLAVRHDANTSLVSADGDYAPLQVDANGALKISGSITTTNSVSNVAIAASNAAITTTESNILAGNLASRRRLIVQNLGQKTVYVGPTGLTSADGYPISAGGAIDLDLGPAVDVFALTASGTANLRILEAA